ncbi:MAG TPA: FUSC family protein, partial [Pirellulales bacterium]
MIGRALKDYHSAMSSEWKNLLLYMAKCITAVVIVFALGTWLQYQEIIWPLVSAILVLTPDSQEAVPLAAIRIGANLIASATSLLFMLVGAANVITLSAALSLTIALCWLCRLMAGSRSALAAVVIIMLHEPGAHPWDAAVERAASVVAGCLLGLVITFV